MAPALEEGKKSHRLVLSRLLKGVKLRKIIGMNVSTARYFSLISNLRNEDTSVPRGLYFTAREGNVRGIDSFGNIIKGGQLFSTALYFSNYFSTHYSTALHSLGSVIDDYSVSHNVNVIQEEDSAKLVGLGGSFSHGNRRARIDAYMAPGLSSLVSGKWLVGSASTKSIETPCYEVKRDLFDGGHQGCFEARHGYKVLKNMTLKYCQFDGKHSLVHKDGKYFLYSRMNMKETGGRFLQVTRSAGNDIAGPWLPFKQVSFLAYDKNANLASALNYLGNIYFGAVNPNPVSNRTVLGLFPITEVRTVATKSSEYGYIGMAVSCDGLHFSKIAPLIEVPLVIDSRTIDMPVDGFAVSEKNRISFFVHRNLPGINMEHPEIKVEASEIAQYEISRYRLEHFTKHEMTKMPSCNENASDPWLSEHRK